MEPLQIEQNAVIQTFIRQRETGFNQVAQLSGKIAVLQAELAEAKAKIAELEKNAPKKKAVKKKPNP